MAYTSLHDLALPTYSIYLLPSNTLPKSSVAWNNIYCLAVSVGQEPKCSSAGSSASGLFQAAFKVMERTASHLNAQLERILFQAHSHACWQDSVYLGLLVWRPQSLLITGQTPPPAPYHMGLSIGQLKTLLFVSPEGVSQKNRQRKGERGCMSEGGHGFLQPGLRSDNAICQKWVSKSRPYTRGGCCTRVWTLGRGCPGEPRQTLHTILL